MAVTDGICAPAAILFLLEYRPSGETSGSIMNLKHEKQLLLSEDMRPEHIEFQNNPAFHNARE